MTPKILTQIFPFHAAAFQVAYTSMYEMLNATSSEQSRLIKQWRESTLSQLSHVGLIGAVMSAAVVGSFSWQSLSTIAVVPLTMIQIAWLNSLILAIAAVAVGMQQSVFLVRVGCLSHSDALIRELLSFASPTGRRVPHWDQVILWQTAVGLLECSIYFWLGGYIVFLWHMTRMGREDQQISDQVAAGFCYAALLSVICIYAASMLRLWYSVWQNKASL